jgi:hypothetical protein
MVIVHLTTFSLQMPSLCTVETERSTGKDGKENGIGPSCDNIPVSGLKGQKNCIRWRSANSFTSQMLYARRGAPPTSGKEAEYDPHPLWTW